MKKAKAVKSW